MSDALHVIAYASETALLELRRLQQCGPLVRIVHRFGGPGPGCLPGEEILAVYSASGGRQILIPLTLSLKLLVEYLARNRHAPQSATQIAAGIRMSKFHRYHGKNSGVPSRRKFARTAIKEYIKRLRKAMDVTFREARIPIKSRQVLVSKKTVGNEVHYQLHATVEWVHI